MEKPLKLNEYRRVKINSQYSGFDFFLIKKPLQSNLRIPTTILLDRYGSPKQWIFNSYKLPTHPILKKRKQNLVPLVIIKSLCSKFINHTSLSQFKSIYELKEFVISTLNGRKDAEIMNRKKNLEIRTVDGDILQINIIEFLQIICENKLADHNFYEKWKMIQERVSNSKLDQCYIIESVRRNHIIQSKSSKFIAVSTGNKTTIDKDSNDPFKESVPSKELQVTDTKTLEAYKFFDTYLNKKFFNAVQNFIESVQKNYKCIVESLTTRFVIDNDRQPHLSAVQEIYVKPTSKLFEMKQFTQSVFQGEIKLQSYVRCLQQFLIENPSKVEPNLHQPLSQQRSNKCKGQFCDAVLLSIPHYNQSKFKLPLIVTGNTRKINNGVIEAVKKRRWRVIQKLKESKVLDTNYNYEFEQSSDFQESDVESSTNLKVCENCFVFYINVLKLFELDGFNNIVEKRASSVTEKTVTDQSHKRLQGSNNNIQNGILLSRRRDLKSLKNLHIKTKGNSEQTEKVQLKRAASQQSKFRPVQESNQKLKEQGMKQPKNQKKTKLSSIEKQKQKVEQKTSKLIEAKLSNAKIQSTQTQVSPSKAQTKQKKVTKPTNYHQAAQHLLQKLQTLQCSSINQFIHTSKLYYANNLPQQVDRTCFSQEYLAHLYEFMSNSPIICSPGNRIKKRPEMTLKRLSQLTNYPEIVSRSTFIFDTLICDEKTTIPFCVLSSKMIHNSNNPSKPYQNIIIINDIFDSYIQHISISKQLLQDSQNTRIILFNYIGQSHTIYDKSLPFRTSQFCGILDRLIYRLSSEPNQLNIISKNDTFKFLGLGFGGFLVSAFLSSCASLFPLIKGVTLVNTAYTLNHKYAQVLSSLLELYSVPDPVTEQNAFLFYNKAINSTEVTKEELEDKSGLNSIRLDGRCYLLQNALKCWNEVNHQNFCNYSDKVTLVYSKGNTLVSKTDMQAFLVKQDSEKAILKNRNLIEIEGGHDVFAENYQSVVSLLLQFIN